MSETINHTVIEFIQDYIELIDNNEFEELYAIADDQISALIGGLTDVLLEADIDPFVDLKVVPPGFMYASKQTHFEVPQGIVEIREDAFADAMNLKSVHISDSVKKIGTDCFMSCRELSSVVFSEDSNLASIEESAFYRCYSLQSIEIPSSVISLGANCFSNCLKLEFVALNEGLVNIGLGCFNKTKIETIHIPSTVTYIGRNAFPEGIHMLVHKDSYGHTYAVNHDIDYELI